MLFQLIMQIFFFYVQRIRGKKNLLSKSATTQYPIDISVQAVDMTLVLAHTSSETLAAPTLHYRNVPRSVKCPAVQ